jgi:hypothetical protein
MPRSVVVIDPFEKTVENVTIEEGKPLLDQLRELIGCVQLDTAGVALHLVLWVDNLGLLKGAKQRFWRFVDSKQRIGGRAILTRTDEDGMPMPLSVVPDDLARGIDWCEDVRVERIVETLEVEPSAFGPIPKVIRQVIWAGPEPTIAEVMPIEPAATVPAEERRLFWIVYNDDESGNEDFLAKERVMEADGTGGFTGEERRFETLDEVRAFAKEKDLHFALPAPGDSPVIAATLV